MDLIIIIVLVFAGGGWLIGKLVQSFIPKDTPDPEKPNTTFITHNHETHNHLHVDSETLKKITQRKQ